jgi:hypothetical protein
MHVKPRETEELSEVYTQLTVLRISKTASSVFEMRRMSSYECQLGVPNLIQSYITIDGQSASFSRCQAPIWYPSPIFFPFI